MCKKCGILGDRARSGMCDDGWIRANFPWLEVVGARVCSDFVAVIYLLWDGMCYPWMGLVLGRGIVR